jgi:hypothetical protein
MHVASRIRFRICVAAAASAAEHQWNGGLSGRRSWESDDVVDYGQDVVGGQSTTSYAERPGFRRIALRSGE